MAISIFKRMAHPLVRKLKMNIFHKIGLYLRTLRYLKPVQITNRLKRKCFPAKADLSPAPPLRAFDINELHYIPRRKSILSHNRLHFLNIEGVLDFPEGWNEQSYPKLWLFNLHYFEGLLNDETSVELKSGLIEQWIEDNPPVRGNGWEPYANSLRIVCWIKWALNGNGLSKTAIQSLAVQSRYLMETLEYHLLANHLFVSLKGVIFAGCFFRGEEADRWLDICLKEMDKQISEQFLADGAHFELSPAYHALLTEDLLDIINILSAFGKEVPERWLRVVQKGLEWQQIITRPDGLPPLFNDAAYGISPSLQSLLAYAEKLGISHIVKQNEGFQLLEESGYFRFDGEDYTILGDVGQIGAPYQPAHVHCDMLNFELFIKGNPFIVDTGTSTYDLGFRRNLERGTQAHNTVQILGYEQSEVWGRFRVGRRARLVDRVVSGNTIKASHDGFNNVGATVTRKFKLEDSSLQIEDLITGYVGVAVSRIHFHPNVTVKIEGDIIQAGSIIIKLKNFTAAQIKDYEYAPEFNKRITAKVLEVEFKGALIIEFKL